MVNIHGISIITDLSNGFMYITTNVSSKHYTSFPLLGDVLLSRNFLVKYLHSADQQMTKCVSFDRSIKTKSYEHSSNDVPLFTNNFRGHHI